MTATLNQSDGLWKGLVIASISSGDYDSILVVFSREGGARSFFAKSLRKTHAKLRGILQLFHLVEISFVQGRALAIITGATEEESFPGLYQDPLKTWIASYGAELVHRQLGDEQAEPELFDGFVELLRSAEHLSPDVFFLAVESVLPNVLGYKMDFDHCGLCGKDLGGLSKKVYLLPGGGLSCGTCATLATAKRVNDKDFRSFRQINRAKSLSLASLQLTMKQFRRMADYNAYRWQESDLTLPQGRNKLLELIEEDYNKTINKSDGMK